MVKTSEYYFRELIPIDNPSGREEGIRSYIREQIECCGFYDSEIDQDGNLLVRIPGNYEKEIILLSAHMDSVPPCEGVQQRNNELEGRKIISSDGKTILGADDKSGIALILEILRRIKEEENREDRHPLEIIFSTNEETGLLGAKSFDFNKSKAVMGFVLDGEGSVGDIFQRGPTQKSLRFDIEGVASHAGIAPEAGVSAIEMAIHLCASLPCGRLSPDTTLNIGLIKGGDALNVVASSTTVIGEIRSHNDDALYATLNQIEEICQEIEEHFPGGKIKRIAIPKYSGFELPSDHKVIAVALDACRKIGITPNVTRMNIGSDAHVFNHKGIPSVVLGMGFHYSHSLEEFIYLDELEQVTHLVWEIVHF